MLLLSIAGSLVWNWGLGCVDAELLLQSFSVLFAFEFLGVRSLLLDSMDVGNAIIDISSDEENLVDESFDITEEWVNELLGSVDVEVPGELDDVMVVDELSTRSCMKKPSPLQKECDEDCLILDGDPDKVVSVVDGKSESVDGCAELLIVGEKGHLACRDYPHPRHLCVSFPFNSTPHEKHCKLCHCYVCDSLAPCIYWGYGLSTTDHCHASEKEQDWKSLRNYFKLVLAEVPEPVRLPGSRQSNAQSFRISQDTYHPLLGLSNALHQSSTTESWTAIPDASIQREHQLLNSLSGLRNLPVNRRSLHLIGSQSFPTSLRMPPVPNYFGSTSDENSGFYSQDRSNFNQLHRSSVQRFPYSEVLQGSHRTAVVSPLGNCQSIQPGVSNNMEMIRGMLASIEADLLGTDYNSGSMEESNISSASSLYPALTKPSVIGEAQARI
ncbi:hypothetical protein IEQ34_001384 [Dendrobium chrysotoxum]|uniref:Uncharacterized protein n=1 Tax=Dendrobium chrysotoxum TaxID=161865 RepID=A0AAV7HLI2_DENCH|nr:hypothetical protein IEQ34_001384 [Dendrobium chrysotoxum]